MSGWWGIIQILRREIDPCIAFWLWIDVVFLCSKFYFIIVEYRSLVIVRKLNLEYVIKQTNQKSLYIFAHLFPCIVAMLLYRWHWLSVSIMPRSSFIYYIMQLAMNTFSKEFPPNAVVKSDSDD